MYVARILYPVNVLGPNNRLGIWLAICHHHCKGCSNKELWEATLEQKISVDDLFKTILQIHNYKKIDGFTITGGDPFYQSKELSLLIDKLLTISDDIIIYTGFTILQLHKKNDIDIENILQKIAVLIDGRYIEKLNDNSFMIGSNNQKRIILNPKYQDLYTKYFQENTNQIQNFILDDGIVSVGIHKNDFDKNIKKELKKKYGKK